MKKKALRLLAALITFSTAAHSQCPFNPVITGDVVLCPNATGTLTTQAFDSYQWYRKTYSGDTTELMEGATNQTLDVGPDDVLYYFSVEATQNGCTETSPEILLDSYVFLLPFVAQSGTYTYDPENGIFRICEGDTLFLELGLPYDKNITWYKNDIAIEGENTPLLAITETGAYTVEGAPAVCPEYLQPLGLIIPVVAEPCATDVKPEPARLEVSVYPNPVVSEVTLAVKGGTGFDAVIITAPDGRVVFSQDGLRSSQITVPAAQWPTGIYCVKMVAGDHSIVQKFMKL